jgi:hypothetical protein
LTALLEENPALDPAEQRASLRALLPVLAASGRLHAPVLRAWARWDLEHGVLRRKLDVGAAFSPALR